jgi:mercuric ion transport protein
MEENSKNTHGWLAAGGLIGAIAASSCCILPLALFSIGVGGAWIGNLTALAPYQPIFVVITIGFLGGGYWVMYRKSNQACIEGSYCARPTSNRITKVGLWLATLLILAAIAFPYVAPFFLE